MLTKDFVLGGYAIFTVEPSEAYIKANGGQDHYTYRIEIKEANGSWPEATFVSLLTGPNNTRDYTYLGMLTRNGEVRLTAKSPWRDDSLVVQIIRRVLARVIAGESHLVEKAGWKLHHEGYCGVCGRPLTTPESVESGIGPICRSKAA